MTKTTQKYLSQKKTACQTISLSPALKEWLKRYVRVKHRENNEKGKFKSISAFVSSVLEEAMSQDKL